MKPWSIVAAVASLAGMPAAATCNWEWLCNGDGQCKHAPVCENINENPPPRPEGVQPPAPPPKAARPFKVAGSSVGSTSTLTCEHIMRQGKSGRWSWHEACFCSDPNKARDPSAPFANIVRCEAQQ